MSWKFVFRPKLFGGDSFDKAYEQACATCYAFFLFNGNVFFLGQDKPEFTGITAEDLY